MPNLMKINDEWHLPVPVELNRKQLDKLTDLMACTDDEGVATWQAILEIFGLAPDPDKQE